MYNGIIHKPINNPNLNTAYNQTNDQAQECISFYSENGMLCLPTRLNGFKQTHFEQQEFVRNEGTKAKPFIRKRKEYIFLGSYEDPEGKELRKCPACGVLMHKNWSNVTRLRYCNFKWFANFLKNYKEGMVSYAKYRISNGKIEGINQKIKMIRRQS